MQPQQPQPSEPDRPQNSVAVPWYSRTILQVVSGAAILALAFFVALNPNLMYPTFPRVILCVLIALLPALLFGSAISARVKFTAVGFVWTASGIFAAFMILLIFLVNETSPEEKIAIYYVYKKVNGKRERAHISPDMITIQESNTFSKSRYFTDDSTIIVVFPNESPKLHIEIQADSTHSFSGVLPYSGNRTSTLELDDGTIKLLPN